MSEVERSGVTDDVSVRPSRAIAAGWHVPALIVVTVSLGVYAGAESDASSTRPTGARAPSPADETAKRARPAALPYRVSTEQILIRNVKSFDPSGIERTEEEALEVARRVLEDLRSGKLTFHQACEQFSEDRVSRKNGGYMGIFERGELAVEFEEVESAIFHLKTGEVSEPVASPLGIHIFRRIPIEEWAGSHILVQYAGAKRAPAALRRTRAEAEASARRILASARKPDADFAALARRYSEAPDSAVGGSMGIFGRYEILPQLQRAIARLRVGEVGGPVESPLGWHVVRRDPMERVHAAHILVRFKGSENDFGVSRSRAEALARAEEILKLVREPGADFASLARKYSEEGSSSRGGRIGLFPRGKLLPEFEKAVFGLEVGGTSGIVETDHGFHIIKRLPEE